MDKPQPQSDKVTVKPMKPLGGKRRTYTDRRGSEDWTDQQIEKLQRPGHVKKEQ
jgi:hypothetical protein